jgi:predicted  nucleic acid-binding Zn-ribbon protein
MSEPICSECGELIHVESNLEWIEGDICWKCGHAAFLLLEKEVIKLNDKTTYGVPEAVFKKMPKINNPKVWRRDDKK